jgi:MoaA/NifB/PqqE/SkfB family radical SAM enzyme
MANVSLTLACNRRCSYCFAPVLAAGASAWMSSETFASVLALLRQSGVTEARLLGGEPTLHPQFLAFVRMALDSGLRVRVFSNGLMPGPLARALAAEAARQVSVLVNVNGPERSKPGELEWVSETLGLLGPVAQIGHNVVDPAAELEFLLDLVEAHALQRVIRLGLAHPCVGAANDFLHPKRYAWAGTRICSLELRARQRGVRLEPDCGFVPCMFPEGFLGGQHGFDRQIGLQCGAVPDILPDGTAIPCYPLALLRHAPLTGRGRLQDVEAELSRSLAPLRQLSVFPDCLECAARTDGSCRGGCLAASLRRVRGQLPLLATGAPGADSARERRA